MSLYFESINTLSKKLAKKDISSVELTTLFLDRIEKHDAAYNSFVTVTKDAALTSARAADEKLAKGNAHPLTGIPIAQKDIFCTEGVKTACGSKMLDNFIAPYNATIVARCNDAGMVMLGKTNMDEFAMGSSNETSFYGAVKNPWDTARVPGGSSGGSAAAIAAGLAPIATGSDTGGSIRQPASYCNLTGLKPTYGEVSRYGMIAFASSLDQAGPLGRNAEDCALLMDVMAGYDSKDSTSRKKNKIHYQAALTQSLAGKKIGLPKEFFTKELDPTIAEKTMAVTEFFKKMGAEIHEISLPRIGLSIPVYYVIAPAEASSNLARYDGVRYGYRCDNPRNLDDLYGRSRAEGFGAEVKRRIMIGTSVLSSNSFDAYYLKAQQVRKLITQDFNKAFETVDMILSPSVTSTAFKIGEKQNDPVSMYLSDIYTAGVNLAGLPATSAPCGFIDALPIGFQLIGPHFSDANLLCAVHQYQQENDFHLRMPEGL
jgi:aspartyl-tRNA(Asn)/glutamyl-tRNA(Gln) amidotransferase subunit A